MSKERHKIRFLHNIPTDINITVYIDGKVLAENLEYKDFTSYLTIRCKSDNRVKCKIMNYDNVIVRKNLKIKSKYTTVLFTEISDGRSAIKILPDYLNKPTYGHSYIRFIQGVFNIPSVDLFINKQRVSRNISYCETGYPIYHNYKLTGDPFALITIKINGVKIVSTEIYITSRSIVTLILSGNTKYPYTLITSQDNGSDTYRLDKLEPNFSLQSYMGKWYQISQFGETDESSYTYTLLQDIIKVYDKYNSCHSLEISDVRFPTVLRESRVTKRWGLKYKLRFVPGPNYIIHKTDYISYALVGSPARNSLYIFSRTPTLCHKKYKELVLEAEILGYDISKLVGGKQK